MAQELPATDPIAVYAFESESQLFEIPVDCDKGHEFQALSSADEKLRYLKENGKETTKEVGGRIMIPQKGAWYHRNLGQIEYLIPVESELGEQYGVIKDNGAEKVFWEKNVTRIREWPERIVRNQDFLG
jgi:hypothetical protein